MIFCFYLFYDFQFRHFLARLHVVSWTRDHFFINTVCDIMYYTYVRKNSNLLLWNKRKTRHSKKKYRYLAFEQKLNGKKRITVHKVTIGFFINRFAFIHRKSRKKSTTIDTKRDFHPIRWSIDCAYVSRTVFIRFEMCNFFFLFLWEYSLDFSKHSILSKTIVAYNVTGNSIGNWKHLHLRMRSHSFSIDLWRMIFIKT